MFKKRKHKIAVLEQMLYRLAEIRVDTLNDREVDNVFKNKVTAKLDEESDALIAALVAYETEPISIAAAVVITSIFWLGIVWPIVSVI